jgi:hypothetical protein
MALPKNRWIGRALIEGAAMSQPKAIQVNF